MPFRRRPLVQLLLSTVLVTGLLGAGGSVASAEAAVCADHPNQASAQKAKDTRDADGDGIYCESLRCPCAKPGSGSVPKKKAPVRKKPKKKKAKKKTAARTKANSDCTRSSKVVPISFSSTKYPAIAAHTRTATAAGWPSVLRINRVGTAARRKRLLSAGFPTKPGFDRDEYPPAVGRGKGPGLERGTSPQGWRASVAYVPSSENRSHGTSLGIKLRRYCDGQRFRYVFF